MPCGLDDVAEKRSHAESVTDLSFHSAPGQGMSKPHFAQLPTELAFNSYIRFQLTLGATAKIKQCLPSSSNFAGEPRHLQDLVVRRS